MYILMQVILLARLITGHGVEFSAHLFCWVFTNILCHVYVSVDIALNQTEC